jgi:hypothetical protein
MIKTGTRYFANSSSGMTKRRAQDGHITQECVLIRSSFTLDLSVLFKENLKRV